MDVRYGPRGPSDWLKFPGDATTAGSAPTAAGAAAACEGRQVEWVFYKPADLTAYTLHYGRWVEGPDGLDAWMQVGTVVEAAAGSAAKYVPVPAYDTNGDRVAAYVDGLTGTPATAMKLWYRVIP